MACTYCINRFDRLVKTEELGATGWIDGLARIQNRADLPLTLQGGEPTIHPQFYTIVDGLYRKGIGLDLVTNGMFNLDEFVSRVDPYVFKRRAKYASIRFSLHKKTNQAEMVSKVHTLQKMGYKVGIWGFDNIMFMNTNRSMIRMCKERGIDFRTKRFLSTGWEKNTYKYQNACTKLRKLTVKCKPSELLINPSGFIFRCHHDLYNDINPMGHILNDKVKLIRGFRRCEEYGVCNPCDVKVKFNRFQEWGHCSVEIKGKGVN